MKQLHRIFAYLVYGALYLVLAPLRWYGERLLRKGDS
jgi:hypothetical protein